MRDRSPESMQRRLSDLGVETELVQKVSGVETLKVPDRNIDEIRMLVHNLPTRGAIAYGMTGSGHHKYYYEVHYIVRGYPFTQAGAEQHKPGALSRVLAPSLLIVLFGALFVALLLAILGHGSAVATRAALTAAGVAALWLFKLRWWRRFQERNWRARTREVGRDPVTGGMMPLTWKGGAIAGALNRETQLNTALASKGLKRITVSPKRWQEVVEIRSGLFESLQEAVPSREAFDAYDTMARRLREMGTARV